MAMRQRWECAGCGVTARHADGHPIPVPRGWVDGRCVACHRARLRSEGQTDDLVRFELRRGATVNRTARVAGVRLGDVTRIRRALIAGGEVLPAPPRPRRRARTLPTGRGSDAVRRAGATPSQRKHERDLETLRGAARGITTRQFAEARGVVRATANKRLNRLVEAGLAVVEGYARPGVQRIYRPADRASKVPAN